MKATTKVWQYLRRSPHQSLAATMVMFSNFFLISAVVFVLFGLSSVLRFLETRPEVTAFLKDEVSTAQRDALVQKLEAEEGIKEVRYVSKEEALKIYQQDFSDNPLLLEMVTAEVLPASLEISAQSPEVLKNVVSELTSQADLFEEVVFQQEVVDSLLKWTQTAEKIGGGLIVFLSMVSLVVIWVIISMKITLRKKEISILNLLGAEGSYIRNPFLLEGIFYGVVGAILGWSIVVTISFLIRPKLVDYFQQIPFWPSSFLPFLLILGAEMLFGAIIGLLASFMAVKKQLHK
ncbi:MAG: permease-like cell division protein FtsX [Candidatus Shapirobacteria bacterium]